VQPLQVGASCQAAAAAQGQRADSKVPHACIRHASTYGLLLRLSHSVFDCLVISPSIHCNRPATACFRLQDCALLQQGVPAAAPQGTQASLQEDCRTGPHRPGEQHTPGLSLESFGAGSRERLGSLREVAASYAPQAVATGSLCVMHGAGGGGTSRMVTVCCCGSSCSVGVVCRWLQQQQL
jgi:hypothetical protein